jgi:hypothetical protein
VSVCVWGGGGVAVVAHWHVACRACFSCPCRSLVACLPQRLIQSGVDNLDSGIGVYAGDESTYSLFAPLLDPILHEYHNTTAVCAVLSTCSASAHVRHRMVLLGFSLWATNCTSTNERVS